MRKLPTTYVIALGALVVIVAWVLLTYFGVPPFDNISYFIVFNAAGVVTLLIAGVVGGAFVGMLLAHRMLGNREFSPFERTVLQSLEDVRERLDRLESKQRSDEEMRARR